MSPHPGTAWFPGLRASGVLDAVDLSEQPTALDRGGFWVLVGDFEGRVRAWRMAEVERTDAPVRAAHPWAGPSRSSWTSSLDRDAYCAGVERVRAHIREGEVYQVNLCRQLAAPLPVRGESEPDAAALDAVLRAGNPAPHAGGVHIPAGGGVPGAWVVSASPELYLSWARGVVRSGPIKGTARVAEELREKDRAENVMIADMVRNDLQRVCLPGTVEVAELLGLHAHPGLVHLVTTVQGRLAAPPTWPTLAAATYPPASVSGAPKRAALAIIEELEPTPRGPYCGAIGWLDADRQEASLAVAIRTFWWSPDRGGTLRFGTGAGITWESVPEDEWAETELKAARLIALASGDPADGPGSVDAAVRPPRDTPGRVGA